MKILSDFIQMIFGHDREPIIAPKFKCIFSRMLVCTFLLAFQRANCQNIDSTRFNEIDVEHESSLVTHGGLLQILELILNAEDVLNKGERHIIKKPQSLIHTPKWEPKDAIKSDGIRKIVIDTGSGALVIALYKKGNKPNFMMFNPSFVSTQEAIDYLRDSFKKQERYDYDEIDNGFVIHVESGRKVVFNQADFPELGATMIMIMLY